MTSLQQLEALLQAGADQLPPAFKARQLAFLMAAQQPDGGFAGRAGGSDLYYTDFALRLAALLGAEPALRIRAAAYVSSLPAPRDVVELFCRLNCRRLVGDGSPAPDPELSQLLTSWALPRSGHSKAPGEPLSAYACFLAALSEEMLGELGQVPAGRIAKQVLALQGEGGGFRDLAGVGPEQTSATAAATGLLGLTGMLPDKVGLAAARFLAAQQTPDGGLAAHAAAPVADLLSTFTGLVALMGLPGDAAVDLGGIARFAAACARPTGGFVAWSGDEDPDLEYTYYGVATLALLRVLLPPGTEG